MNVDPSIAPPDEPDPELGRVIRRLRETQGLSQADLAKRSQVDLTILSQVEDGAVDPPWATVQAIARGLGVSVKGIADAVVERQGKPSER
ncbi:MAG: Helix-turn-helix domain [Solirubrobacterales bacterium]|nr:Helix-turn-helix domain [Solirubrobacterales bacterium]